MTASPRFRVHDSVRTRERTANMAQLLPCPFCGEAPQGDGVFVMCATERCAGGMHWVIADAWNRRAAFPVAHDRTTTFIPQRESWDCGVACLAMAAGITYEAALASLSTHDIEYAKDNKGIPSNRIAQHLGQLGLASRQVFCSASDWREDGLSGLRMADVGGHYVIIRPDNLVNDPARGEGREPDAYKLAFNVWEIHPLVALAPK